MPAYSTLMDEISFRQAGTIDNDYYCCIIEQHKTIGEQQLVTFLIARYETILMIHCYSSCYLFVAPGMNHCQVNPIIKTTNIQHKFTLLGFEFEFPDNSSLDIMN